MKKVIDKKFDCCICINSIIVDGILHCKTKIKDWNDIKDYSKVLTVKECGLFKIEK